MSDIAAGADPIVLDPVEQRVLGSLLEKERTVPASYPMTLNGLRTACNQSSGRDPITDLDEREINDAIERLKARGLARLLHASHGARVVKFRQVLDERLQLTDAERAILTVLLLRGPQTPGEMRSRSERLHTFPELAELDAALDRLASRPVPLVAEQERRPGQKERRWIHLLGPVAEPALEHAEDPTRSDRSADLESVLAGGAPARDAKVLAAYETVAASYATELVDELSAKPFDRWLLERLAAEATGPVLDAGCGPGQVTFHLAAAGADVVGLDSSPAMIAEARRLFPELRFEVGDYWTPPGPSGGGPWSSILAWYSLVHLAPSELAPAFGMLSAALRPGGRLAVALHIGSTRRHLDEWWGHEVDLDFVLHDPARVLAAATSAGFTDIEWYRRGPYPGVEADTERMYLLAYRMR